MALFPQSKVVVPVVILLFASGYWLFALFNRGRGKQVARSKRPEAFF